jgi:hypothetical protein
MTRMTAQRFTVNLIFRFKCEAYGLRIHAQNNFSKVVSLCQSLARLAGIFQREYLIDQWFGSREAQKIKHPPEVLSRS